MAEGALEEVVEDIVVAGNMAEVEAERESNLKVVKNCYGLIPQSNFRLNIRGVYRVIPVTCRLKSATNGTFGQKLHSIFWGRDSKTSKLFRSPLFGNRHRNIGGTS
jgi:hypothetical protein